MGNLNVKRQIYLSVLGGREPGIEIDRNLFVPSAVSNSTAMSMSMSILSWIQHYSDSDWALLKILGT